MIRALLAGMVSSNPVVIGALAGGAAVALFMAARGGRGPRTH